MTGSLDARQMEDALRNAGCRITRQRRAIIGYLACRDDHPSARQVYGALHHRESGLSRATVYNTLHRLVETGLLTEIEFEAGDNRFDTNLRPHVNLICVECGAIADFEHELPVTAAHVERRLGFLATDFRVEYRGVCARCRSQSAGRRGI